MDPQWPDGVTLVTIRHRPVTTGGRTLGGNMVTAVASERLWTDDGSILPAEASTRIAADGSWEITLPAVDEGVRPAGAAYRLTEHVPGAADRHLWVAPLAAHAPGPVDLVDVLSPQPKPGGGITFQTGPATDPSMAEVARDPGSEFRGVLAGAIDARVDDVIVVDNPTLAGRYVASPQVRRIIAAEQGTTPVLEDGDMVVYYTRPGRHYYHDFTTDTPGQLPAGWSQPWQQQPWQVLDVPDATGGRALTVDPTPGNAVRNLLALDAVTTDPARADVELLYRVRSTGATPYVLMQAMCRASGTETSETGYRLGHHSITTLSISRYASGQWFSSSSTTVPTAATDQWWMVRARVQGTTQRIKLWADTDPEPQGWTHVATDTNITGPGMVGLFANGMPNLQHIDWVAIATGGRTAVPL